jgi:uncharacterized protein (DUF58 family)
VPAPSRYGSLLDALRGVTWPGRVPARGRSTGIHRSTLLGTSPEFTAYRPYRQGDDPRRLDWKLLARSDRAYIRMTSDRATMPTMVVCDASASMAFPPDTRGKWEQACRLAVGIAAVAHESADPVGVLVAGAGEPRHLAPRTRRGVVAEIARVLTDVVPSGDAPLAPAVALTRDAQRLVLLTDLLGDVDGLLREAKARAMSGGEVHVVHIVARAELEPAAPAITAVDPEQPMLRRALGEGTRASYDATFAAWREEMASRWREARAAYAMVIDDESAERAVRRVVAP